MRYENTTLRPQTQDLTNQPFGRWIVRSFAGYRNNIPYWTCECACGRIKDVHGHNLKNHMSQSCGCLSIEITKQSNTTHGKRKAPEYHVWHTMIQRCHNPNNPTYPLYGARGITVCEAWRLSFEQFYAEIWGHVQMHTTAWRGATIPKGIAKKMSYGQREMSRHAIDEAIS